MNAWVGIVPSVIVIAFSSFLSRKVSDEDDPDYRQEDSADPIREEMESSCLSSKEAENEQGLEKRPVGSLTASSLPAYKTDSDVQSIDESMTKFKGRSVLKQYIPLKPVKSGIKLWLRCDSVTGYTYDFNVYCGKETIHTDGTLGEVRLIDTLPNAAVGNVIKTRKMYHNLQKKLESGASFALQNTSGTLAVKWHDTKEVLVLSNCPSNTKTTVKRTQRNGTRIDVECSDSVAKFMRGVNIADQMMVTLYDHDRKSAIWWKKVIYRLLLISAVNVWIVFKEVRGENIQFLQFLVGLAEGMIAYEKERAQTRRKKPSGRPSKRFKTMLNVDDHHPVEGNTRK
ncbi:hypothetical protein PR048_028487 [Dryococelus australis]|uniref:PiggyBac transposable element-derived protein domain-containing protein n=1 Tax=Dryococelus australis TaxID=614101 RepID=A0ABQ9GAS3_9NEOP|nr:hypothetical protein PR048_028487 [Dryococelus australis]